MHDEVCVGPTDTPMDSRGDGEVTGYEDVFTKIAMCRRHYAECGLGEGYVDAFVR